MATPEPQNQIESPEPAFQRAGKTARTPHSPEGFAELVRQLGKFHHTVEGGILTVPLKKTYMSGAVVKAVAAATMYPALQDHIVFLVAGEKHPYKDIVWDVQERGLKLARQIYRETQRQDPSPTRILITPPVIGRDPVLPHVYPCRILEEKAKDGRDIRLNILIAHDHALDRGLRQIVQTGSIALASADGSIEHSKALSLMIAAAPANIASYQLPGQPVEQTARPAHDRV